MALFYCRKQYKTYKKPTVLYITYKTEKEGADYFFSPVIDQKDKNCHIKHVLERKMANSALV